MKAQLSIEFQLSMLAYISFILLIVFYLYEWFDDANILDRDALNSLNVFSLSSIYSFSSRTANHEIFIYNGKVYMKTSKGFSALNLLFTEEDGDYA